MATSTIDAKTLRNMFLAGAKKLESKKEWINELNVFPVPDGDTGTNMTLTIMAAAKEVGNLSEVTMDTLAKAISSGSLRGARGNSGVILSQLFRGFTKEIQGIDNIDTDVLAVAFERAVETAYKAVMKPKEGTILTVAKGVSEKATEIHEEVKDIEEFIKQVIDHGDYVLSMTPEMLPVLKQAGVVDSGGQGLMTVLKGAYEGFLGGDVEIEIEQTSRGPVSSVNANTSADEVDIKFGYCTEFIIMLEKEYNPQIEAEFKSYLESIGDSLVVVSDDDIVKVHVHTNDPGLAFQRALTYGQLSNMKIDNMRLEHHEKLIKDASKISQEQKAQEEETKKALEERKDSGFISVSVGDGLSEIFRGLGVDYIIEGGQTMNPSTEDMLNAIDMVNADNIYIFPNNKNIILAAEQARELVEDKNVIVIPSKTIPQGITAIINYIPDRTAQENADSMIAEMSRVKTGQVTYAVRDTSIDGKEIKSGDIMGIGDSSILTVENNVKAAVLGLAEELINDDAELVSVYYGADVDENHANEIISAIEERFPDVEVELHNGGQPVYYYIMSVE